MIYYYLMSTSTTLLLQKITPKPYHVFLVGKSTWVRIFLYKLLKIRVISCTTISSHGSESYGYAVFPSIVNQ